MSAPHPPRDDRWKGAMALSVVGCAVTVLAALSPSEGFTLGGTAVRISYPEAWQAWLNPAPAPIVVPRWKPEDVSDLLAQYDSNWTAATAVGLPADSLASIDPTAPDRAAVVSVPVDSAAAMLADTSTTPVAAAVPKQAPTPAPPRHAQVTIPDASALPPALRLSIPESARGAFGQLFAQLDQSGDIQVLHYGDSQIEGDRISGVMRDAWQGRWGGGAR